MSEQLDHEKLDVYQIGLEFVRWSTGLLEAVERSSPSGTRHIRDHPDRARLSILFNTAEGNGKRPMRTRAKFFDDARGSATECGACLDALVAVGFVDGDRVRPGKEMLVRIVSMLTRLVGKFSND